MIYYAWFLSLGIQGFELRLAGKSRKTAFQYDYTANLPISNCPKALCKSVGLRMIATPRTPEPMEISAGTKTDSSARIRIGRGNPYGVTAPRTNPVAASTSTSLAMEIRAIPNAARRGFHEICPGPAISTMMNCRSASRKTILRTI